MDNSHSITGKAPPSPERHLDSEPHRKPAMAKARFGFKTLKAHLPFSHNKDIQKPGTGFDNTAFQTDDENKESVVSKKISLPPDSRSADSLYEENRIPRPQKEEKGSTNTINSNVNQSHKHSQQPENLRGTLTEAVVVNALSRCQNGTNYDTLAKKLSDVYGFEFDDLENVINGLSMDSHSMIHRIPASYQNYPKTSLFYDAYHDICKIAGKCCHGLPYLVLKLLDTERTLINPHQSSQNSNTTCSENHTRETKSAARAIRCIFFMELLNNFSNPKKEERRGDLHQALSEFLNSKDSTTDNSNLKNDLLFFSPFIFKFLKHRNEHSIEESQKHLNEYLENPEHNLTEELKSTHKLLFEMLFHKERKISAARHKPETYKHQLKDCENNLTEEYFYPLGIWHEAKDSTTTPDNPSKDLRPSFIKDDEIPGMKISPEMQDLLLAAHNKFNINVTELAQMLGVTRAPQGCGVFDPITETIGYHLPSTTQGNMRHKPLHFKDQNAGFLLHLLLSAENKVKSTNKKTKRNTDTEKIKKQFVTTLFDLLEKLKRRDLQKKALAFCIQNRLGTYIPYEKLRHIDTPFRRAVQPAITAT